MKKILWPLIFLSLAACKDRVPTPDPFNMSINGIHLAIPKSYIDSGVGISSNESFDDINTKAATSTGVNTNSFLTFINTENAQPWPKGQVSKDVTNMTNLTLSFADKKKLFLSPEFEYEKILKSEKRFPEKDVHGLMAYESSFGSITYISNKKLDHLTIISCGGFGLKNPTCTLKTLWNGLIVNFDFSYTHFPNWKSIQNNIFDLLNSFHLKK